VLARSYSRCAHLPGLWRRPGSRTREVAPAATQDARVISHHRRLAEAVTTSDRDSGALRLRRLGCGAPLIHLRAGQRAERLDARAPAPRRGRVREGPGR
jgi:hypothetical protein